MSRDMPQQRITTHSRRADRRRRAKELQERMAADPRSVQQREHERGYHKNCDHSSIDLIDQIFTEQSEERDLYREREYGKLGDSNLEPWA